MAAVKQKREIRLFESHAFEELKDKRNLFFRSRSLRRTAGRGGRG